MSIQKQPMPEDLRRLRWSCRRGMWELDLLLQKFLDDCYLQLNPAQQVVFVELLACHDQALFLWFTGREVAPEEHLQHMVELIREHGKTQPTA